MHGSLRNPIFFDFQQLLCCLNHLVDVESWDTKLNMALVHSSEIPVDSVGHYSSVNSLIRLCTFETLNTVVKGRVLGHQLEGHVGDNHRSLPSAVLTVVVNLEHVVGSNASESVLMVCWWLWLEHVALLNDKIAGHESLFVGRSGRHCYF